MRTQRRFAQLAALLGAALFAATVSAAQPLGDEDQVATSQAAIINAMAAGADVHAPHELEKARGHMALTRHWVVQKDFVRARLFAKQAEDEASRAEARALKARERPVVYATTTR